MTGSQKVALFLADRVSTHMCPPRSLVPQQTQASSPNPRSRPHSSRALSSCRQDTGKKSATTHTKRSQKRLLCPAWGAPKAETLPLLRSNIPVQAVDKTGTL